MRFNDISNRQSPILAFNIDNLLFAPPSQPSTFIAKLQWKFKSEDEKLLDRPFNKDFINMINYIWNKFDYSIYFITFNTHLVDNLYEKLSNINYTSLISISDKEELRGACEKQFYYYFDTDEEILSYISKPNALHLDQLKYIIRG